jgi:membrane-bound metal-dependent hydrolase YbcI (DUF457 family)
VNFKGHIIGGSLVAASTCTIAYSYSNITCPYTLISIFTATIFFSLFPDLDISSIPQRWFYRGVFILLITLLLKGAFATATICAIVAITPVMSHHRGWTHSFIMPFVAPIIIATLYELSATHATKLYSSHGLIQLSIHNIRDHLATHKWLAISCCTGWLTHLILDKWRRIKLKKPILK